MKGIVDFLDASSVLQVTTSMTVRKPDALSFFVTSSVNRGQRPTRIIDMSLSNSHFFAFCVVFLYPGPPNHVDQTRSRGLYGMLTIKEHVDKD